MKRIALNFSLIFFLSPLIQQGYACVTPVLAGETSKTESISLETPNTFDNKNYTDELGRRQGYWIILGFSSSDDGYMANQKVEEGEYIDNKRSGLWKKFYPSGGIQSEINYVENHPYGSYITYYPNNRVEEAGYWTANKNTGDFKRFYENGQLAQEFNFNSHGKRDGLQKYYYPDGTLQCAVEIDNGVAHGSYKVYYPNGELLEEKRMTNGEVEPGSSMGYNSSKPIKKEINLPELSRDETTPNKSDQPNLAEFKSNGFNTLYNNNKQITQVGDFVEGRLWNGKWYKYDEDGILRRHEVYKEGRFIGYGIIDDSNK